MKIGNWSGLKPGYSIGGPACEAPTVAAIHGIVESVSRYLFDPKYIMADFRETSIKHLETLGINESTYVVPKTWEQRRDEVVQRLQSEGHRDTELLQVLKEAQAP